MRTYNENKKRKEYRRNIWGYFLLMLFFGYIFIAFDELFIPENVTHAGNYKTKIVSSIILALSETIIGYVIVRAIPIILAIASAIGVYKNIKNYKSA